MQKTRIRVVVATLGTRLVLPIFRISFRGNCVQRDGLVPGVPFSSGETALHFAAGLASSAVHAFSTSADYHELSTAGFWPGLFWSPMPKLEVVRLLLAAKAGPNAVDLKGATPLMYAAEAGLPEVLRALLAAGADPDAQDAEGRTALMYAADHCQTESVRSLVQAGVDVTLKDSNGYTALKRVRRKPSKYGRKMCGTSRKQIIHILRVR